MHDRARRSQSHAAASRSSGGGDDGSPRDAGRGEFAALFAAHTPVLRAIAGGVLGRSDLVDDVLQEAAVIALDKYDSFQPGTSFPAWMGRIVRYTALNLGRGLQRSRHRAADGNPVESLAASDDALPPRRAEIDGHGYITIGREEFDQRVLAALNALDETARICLLLRVLHQTPYRDISAILDIPEGTAMSHVHRARRALRAILVKSDLAAPSARGESP